MTVRWPQDAISSKGARNSGFSAATRVRRWKEVPSRDFAPLSVRSRRMLSSAMPECTFKAFDDPHAASFAIGSTRPFGVIVDLPAPDPSRHALLSSRPFVSCCFALFRSLRCVFSVCENLVVEHIADVIVTIVVIDNLVHLSMLFVMTFTVACSS